MEKPPAHLHYIDPHPLERYDRLVRNSSALSVEDKHRFLRFPPDEFVIRAGFILDREVMDAGAKAKREIRQQMYTLLYDVLYGPEKLESEQPRVRVSPMFRELIETTGCLTTKEKIQVLREMPMHRINDCIRELDLLPHDTDPALIRSVIFSLVDDEEQF